MQEGPREDRRRVATGGEVSGSGDKGYRGVRRWVEGPAAGLVRVSGVWRTIWGVGEGVGDLY